MMVAALQGVAAFSVVVQARRPGHNESDTVSLGVMEPLDQIPPPRKLVDLVEHHELLASGEPSAQQTRANSRVVPVEVSGVPPPRLPQGATAPESSCPPAWARRETPSSSGDRLLSGSGGSVGAPSCDRPWCSPALRVQPCEQFKDNSKLLMSKIDSV